MISTEEMKRLENFLFSENIGCVFKQVYSDESERIFIEYSGITILEFRYSHVSRLTQTLFNNIPLNWESEIEIIQNKIEEFYKLEMRIDDK